MSATLHSLENLHRAFGGGFEPRANGQGIQLIDSADGMVRFADDQPVVLATSRAVEEFGGRMRLRLDITKAMIGRWREDGILNSDGSMVMLHDHGDGFDTNITDQVGRWERVGVEDRADKTEKFRVLVGHPAFDPSLMAAWMMRSQLQPDDWRGLIERRMITHTSIRPRIRRDDMRKVADDNGVETFKAPFTASETSLVWKGRDTKSGIGRAEDTNDMTPEEVQALIDITLEKQRKETTATATVLEATIETVDIPVVRSDEANWTATCKIAYQVLGADAPDVIAGNMELDGRCAKLSEIVRQTLSKQTTSAQPPAAVPAPVDVRPRTTIDGGEPQAYKALEHLETVMVARGFRDVPDGTVRDQDRPGTLAHVKKTAIAAAVKLYRNYETITPMEFLIPLARGLGAVPSNWYANTPEEMVRALTLHWPMSDQSMPATMGGRWLAGQNPVLDSQGQVMVLETLRHGSAGSLRPADLPAVYLNIITKIFLQVHDSLIHDLASWGRNMSTPTLNEQTLIRHDMAVTFDAVNDTQNLPEALLFDEAVDVSTTKRGLVWAAGWDSMFTDGAQILTGVPAIMAMRWMSVKIAHWFKVLTAGIFTKKGGTPTNIYTDQQSQTEADLGAWFDSILIASGDARPVAPPDPLPKGVELDVPGDGMEPTLLLYGNRTNRVFSDHFAPRQAQEVTDTTTTRQLQDFEEVMRDNRRRTKYIKDRKAFALITSGPATAMTSVGLAGQGMQIETNRNTNPRSYPDIVIKIIDQYDAFLTHPNSVYLNDIPT